MCGCANASVRTRLCWTSAPSPINEPRGCQPLVAKMAGRKTSERGGAWEREGAKEHPLPPPPPAPHPLPLPLPLPLSILPHVLIKGRRKVKPFTRLILGLEAMTSSVGARQHTVSKIPRSMLPQEDTDGGAPRSPRGTACPPPRAYSRTTRAGWTGVHTATRHRVDPHLQREVQWNSVDHNAVLLVLGRVVPVDCAPRPPLVGVEHDDGWVGVLGPSVSDPEVPAISGQNHLA